MGTGKKKIEIKKIEKERARMVTFSKRRQGLFKKASEYTAKTGSAVAILVFSPAGKPYVHGCPCFDTEMEKFMKDIGNGCQEGVEKSVKGESRGQEGGEQVRKNGGDGGGGNKLEEMFSGLEKRIRSSESVEELMEVRSLLEKLREKVVKKVKYEQEDNFVDSLFSCDFWPPAGESENENAMILS